MMVVYPLTLKTGFFCWGWVPRFLEYATCSLYRLRCEDIVNIYVDQNYQTRNVYCLAGNIDIVSKRRDGLVSGNRASREVNKK